MTGLLSGLMIAIYRVLLNPAFVIYAAIAVVAGLLSGLVSRRIRDFQKCLWIGFWTACVIGVLHGLVAYLPAIRMIPWQYFLLTMGLIAVLEGTGVLIFMAVISGVVREQNRRQMENDLLKTRLLFLQAQMSPHFLFNTLNTISSICGREHAHQAKNLILRLAEFLRRALKREDEKVTFREEMAYIDAYLDIEKARFQDRLQVEKSIKLSDDERESEVPLLVLQPLVENAIRHGIAKKESGGTVHIEASVADRALKVEISDDGVGMEPELCERVLVDAKSHAQGLGIGVTNIHQRLVRIYGAEYGLQFESEKGKGTKVTVRIPILKEEKAS